MAQAYDQRAVIRIGSKLKLPLLNWSNQRVFYKDPSEHQLKKKIKKIHCKRAKFDDRLSNVKASSVSFVLA